MGLSSYGPIILPIAACFALLAILGLCLVFTHSRSGLAAALLAGFVAVILGSKRPVVWLICGGVIACLGGFGLSFLQRESLDAAVKSLAFRLEYWQATWAMIGDFPLFGCGPGQFQDTYTAYKLPAASEEIADPHSFLLEVWSNGGSLAMAALVASLVAIAWQTFRGVVLRPPSGSGISAGRSRDDRANRDAAAAANELRYVYFGAGSGVILGAAAAWLDGAALSGMHLAFALASFAATLAILNWWIRSGRIPRHLPAIAAGGLLLHLCVSGGIGEPALATVLWLLCILQISQTPSSPTHLVPIRKPSGIGSTLRRARAPGLAGRLRWSRSKSCLSPFPGTVATAAATVITVVFALASYMTYYRPVLRASGQLASADLAAAAGQRERRLDAIEAAVAADPWSIEAAQRLAAIRFAAWKAAPAGEPSDAWRQADENARRIAPRRHSIWRESSERYAAILRRNGDANALERAIEFAGQAVAHYPTNADHQLFYAEMLYEAGRTEQAERAIAAAIRYDRAKEAAGHDDRTLSADRREKLRELASALGMPL